MIDVQAVLTTSYLLVLTKEQSSSQAQNSSNQIGSTNSEDSVRLVLRGHQNPINKSTYTPVLSVNRLLTRNVATDKTAFFIVQPAENSIYEFVASSAVERKAWTEAIQRLVVTIEQGQLTTSPDSSSSAGTTPTPKSEPTSRPRSIRVEGSISLVSADEEEAQRLVEFGKVTVRDSLVASNVCRCEEAVSVLSPQERLKRLEGQIVDSVNQRSILLKRNRDESELDSSEECDDLLTLVTRLQLTPTRLDGGDSEELKNKIRARLDQF
jgi:hypothetical protein